MATPPLLEFESLIAPIPGENPAGDSVPFEVRDKLEKLRIEVNPEDLDPDDPTRAEIKPQKADWPGIVELAQKTLKETSKDLRVAAQLTEALTKIHGFAGVRDGLHLLGLLVDQCWDRVYPAIEDGDVESRAGPFTNIDVPDRGSRFPSTVRAVPIVADAERGFSYWDFKQSQEGKGTVSREDFEKGVQATDLAQCQAASDDLKQALTELEHLTKALDARMGQVAPGMTGLRQSLDDCRTLTEQIVRMKPSDAGQDQPTTAGGQDPTDRGGGAKVPSGNRAGIYRQLAQSAAVLRQLEPHSPIPYLIERAVQLGNLPFPDLIRALVREPNVLAELSREFGLKEPPPPEPTA